MPISTSKPTPSDPTPTARLRFDSPEGAEPLRTAVIIIEDSFEQAVAAARALDERQLEGLLRSLLPEDPAGQV